MNALSIISLCISIITLSLTLLRDFNSNRREKSNAVIKFLDQGDSPEMKKLRELIYKSSKDLKDVDFQNEIINCYNNKDTTDEQISELETCITKTISFYDKWALLYNKKYLPKWAFEGPRQATFLTICDLIMFYIDFRKSIKESYARDLLKLYASIKSEKTKNNN